MKNNKYDILILLLSACTCFGNVGGAFQVDRILAVVLFPWLVASINRQGYSYARRILKTMALCYGYMAFSFLWTPDKSEGLKELVYYPIHFLLFLEIIVFARKAKNPLISLSRGWMIAVMLCSVVAYWEITTGNHLEIAIEHRDVFNAGGGVILERYFASVTFGNYNAYVTFLCYSIPWIFYALISKDRNFVEQLIAGATLVMASIVTIINASRGGVLAIIVMLFVYYWFSEKSKFKNIVIVALAGILIYGISQYGDSLTAVFMVRSSDGGLYSDESRLIIWNHALMAFFESLGFGVGIGGISAAMEKIAHGGITVTHNMFLELLVQYGIVVALFFIMFLWKLFRKSVELERTRKTALMMAFVAMPVYTIINSRYLLGAHFYVLMATIYIFVNYEIIKFPNRILRQVV